MAENTSKPTKRRQLLNYITRYTSENGYAPSIREMMEAMGVRSSSTIKHHLAALEKGGLLTHTVGVARSYKPVDVNRTNLDWLADLTTAAKTFTERFNELEAFLSFVCLGEPLDAVEWMEWLGKPEGEKLYNDK